MPKATLDPHIFVKFLAQHECSRASTTSSLVVGNQRMVGICWHGSRNTLVYSLTSRPFCLCGFRGSELTTGLPCAKQITKVDVVDVEFSVSKIRGHNYGCAPGGLEDLSWVTVWKLHVGKLVDSFQDSSNLHHMRAWRICGGAARIQPQALLPVCFQRLKYRVRSVQTSPELILFVFPQQLEKLGVLPI